MRVIDSMALIEEQKEVVRALRNGASRSLADEIRRKEALIGQKDLLIAEALDVLTSQNTVELQFGVCFLVFLQQASVVPKLMVQGLSQSRCGHA